MWALAEDHKIVEVDISELQTSSRRGSVERPNGSWVKGGRGR
jgi:hypothetical protein